MDDLLTHWYTYEEKARERMQDQADLSGTTRQFKKETQKI
jgi:hypothetical protein